MARRTDGEKIDALEKVVAAMEVRISWNESKRPEKARSRNLEAFSNLRRDSEREIALLKRDVEEIKRGQERWGQRLWMIIAPLVAGACGVLLAYFLGVKK